jgi:hypothetical protein
MKSIEQSELVEEFSNQNVRVGLRRPGIPEPVASHLLSRPMFEWNDREPAATISWPQTASFTTRLPKPRN